MFKKANSPGKTGVMSTEPSGIRESRNPAGNNPETHSCQIKITRIPLHFIRATRLAITHDPSSGVGFTLLTRGGSPGQRLFGRIFVFYRGTKADYYSDIVL